MGQTLKELEAEEAQIEGEYEASRDRMDRLKAAVKREFKVQTDLNDRRERLLQKMTEFNGSDK